VKSFSLYCCLRPSLGFKTASSRSADCEWMCCVTLPRIVSRLSQQHYFCYLYTIQCVTCMYRCSVMKLWLAIVLCVSIGMSVGLLCWSYRGSHEVRLLFSTDEYIVGLVILWAGCAGVEASIMFVSIQGSVLDTKSRSIMPPLVYIRSGKFICMVMFHIN